MKPQGIREFLSWVKEGKELGKYSEYQLKQIEVGERCAAVCLKILEMEEKHWAVQCPRCRTIMEHPDLNLRQLKDMVSR